jgi:heat shock protein beta
VLFLSFISFFRSLGNTLGRGTEITMFLKEDAMEFNNQARLEEIIKHHSEFITFPIYLYKKTEEVVEKKDDEETTTEEEGEKKEKTSEDGLEVAEEDEEEEKKEDKKPKTERIEKWDWTRLNGNVAIWSRDKSEITEEEYQKFFHVISKTGKLLLASYVFSYLRSFFRSLSPSLPSTGDAATTDALTWIHFKAEGEVDFKSIMYIPSEALNLYDEYNNRKPGMRLYVKRVLIQDDFEDLLPRYLNFIRGVVDSDDLPLNVSRETLQQHKLLKIMGKKLVRKVLEMLRRLSTGKTHKDADSDDDEDNKGKGYLFLLSLFFLAFFFRLFPLHRDRTR